MNLSLLKDVVEGLAAFSLGQLFLAASIFIFISDYTSWIVALPLYAAAASALPLALVASAVGVASIGKAIRDVTTKEGAQ